MITGRTILKTWLWLLATACALNAADYSGSPYGRRLPISGTNILLQGVFPPARTNYLLDGVYVRTPMFGFGYSWSGGEQWWSWTPPFSGEVLFIAEPDGTPMSDEGYAVGFGFYDGDPSGSYPVNCRQIRAPWLRSEPRRLFGADRGRDFLTRRAPYTVAHLTVTQGVVSVVAAVGVPGRPYRFRLLCSPGPVIVKQPPANRRLRVGDSLLLSALVAGPVTDGAWDAFLGYYDLGRSRPLWTSQWFKDGSPINGATNGFLLRDNITAADAGRYHLVVTSATGSTETTPCDVVVMEANAPQADIQLSALGVVGGWLRFRAHSDADSVSITTSTNLAWKPVPDDYLWWGPSPRLAFRLQPGVDAEFQVPVGTGPVGFFQATEYRPLDAVCAATQTAAVWARDQLVLNRNGSETAVLTLADISLQTGFMINVDRKCASNGTIGATYAYAPLDCNRLGHIWVEE